jgi:general secretion pathway protein B
MSYILEALKKAQAERQLGNAPDIHTPAPSPVPAAAAKASRKPLLIGLGVGLAVAGLAVGIVSRTRTPPVQPTAPAVLAQATPAVALPPAPSAPVVLAADALPARPVAAPLPAPAARISNAPAPSPAAPSQPAVAPVPSPPRAAAPKPSQAAARDPVPEAVYLPAPARAPEPAPAAPVRAPDQVQEENLRTLQQLPEAIQREVPKVAVGGYIYSPNPADRLLLIDKTLRREGEEVAPGLVLERLMPKYAVMNYRGTRYRVGY